MASIGDGNVLLFGGYDGADDDETWVYAPPDEPEPPQTIGGVAVPINNITRLPLLPAAALLTTAVGTIAAVMGVRRRRRED